MKKLLFFLAAILLFSEARATIRRVNNAPGINSVYASASSAITAAAPGDTIHLEGSVNSYGSISVTKKLVITGPGFFFADTAANPNTQANKLSAYAEINFGPGSKGSIVQGMLLGSLYLSDSTITVQNNNLLSTITLSYAGHSYGDTLRQNFFGANATIYNTSSYAAKGLFLYNNIIERNSGTFISVSPLSNVNGFMVNNTFTTSAPTNSELTFTCTNFIFQNNVFYKVNFNSLITDNIFLNNIAKAGIPAGNNNVSNIEPADVFAGWASPGTATYSPDARYKLKATSPAINAGTLNGSPLDCGAFGGPASYVLSGMPPIPSIYQLNMPTQVNSGTATISVTIGAAAH